jgi:two-component system, cell cycle sensor histidine kinase and response regulator CckA
MQKDVSCHNTKAIIEYVRRERKGDIRGLLSDLGPDFSALPQPEAYLTDLNNWVSSSFAKRMFTRTRELLGDEEVAYKIGYDAIRGHQFGYVQKIFLMAVGHPREGLRKVQAVNAKFNRTIRVEVVKIGRGSAVLRLHWDKDLDLSRDFCLFTQGIYTAAPTIWEMAPGTLVEKKCYFRGDPYCEYHGGWKEKPVAKRIWSRLTSPRRLYRHALYQMERDQMLLRSKFDEVHLLNLSLERRMRQLASIYEASQGMVSILDLTFLLKEIMSLMSPLLGFDRALLFLVRREKTNWKITQVVGEPEGPAASLPEYQISSGEQEHLLARVANLEKPLWPEDMKDSSFVSSDPLFQSLSAESFMAIPLMSRGKVIGVLVADREDHAHSISPADRDLLLTFSNQIAIAIENAQLYEDLKSSYIRSVQSLAHALEAKDPYTRGHSERVTAYALQIAEEMRLGEEMKEALQCAGLLHDIGKIGIEEAILRKKGALEVEEYEIMKRHPLIGAHILSPISLLGKDLLLIRHHHEAFDGSGYPEGLRAEAIPLGARVLQVADSYDAMTSDRPYRARLSREQAKAELLAKKGKQFDPPFVEAFLAVLEGEKEAN